MKKKRTKKKLIFLLIVDLILVLTIGFFGLFFYFTNKINLNNKEDKSIMTNAIDSKHLKDYRNIAIFGVDSRDNSLEKNTHSDTIIIASIHKKTKDVSLLSIYRDTYVDIPDKGYDKINAAYFKGGYSLALNTINQNFDLNVKEYVTVNFNALCNAIDLLGGIKLDITKDELKYVNGYTKELNKINGTKVGKLKKAGTQVVNGTHSTAYARIRYTAGGDFKRAERQRIVLERVLEKAKKTDIKTLTKIVNEIFPQVYTNLNSLDILSLSKDLLSYDITSESGFPFEKDAHNYKKVSYVFPINLEENVKKLHEFLFKDESYTPSSTIKERSTYIESIRTQK